MTVWPTWTVAGEGENEPSRTSISTTSAGGMVGLDLRRVVLRLDPGGDSGLLVDLGDKHRAVDPGPLNAPVGMVRRPKPRLRGFDYAEALVFLDGFHQYCVSAVGINGKPLKFG